MVHPYYYRQTISLWTQHFDWQRVCNANMLDDFLGYDKLPSHERDYGHGSEHRSVKDVSLLTGERQRDHIPVNATGSRD